jgi:hypothetical protein
MSLGDNTLAKIYRMTENADGHLQYPQEPIFSGVGCSIVRISPEREAKMDLGNQVLAYEMHVGYALQLKLGDRVVDVAGTEYEVFGTDIIRDIDTFTRATLKREYTAAEGF